MKYNKLGTTDIEVSEICLGTMTFGEQNTQEDGFEQMDYALENGVNFFDTAELYSVPAREETSGSTETIVGNWFKARGNRDKVVLATKIVGPGNYFTYFRNGPDYSRTQIREAIEGSLKRLQTDYVDLYQLHWPERKTNFFGRAGYDHDERDQWTDNFAEILESLQELVKEGKILHFGVSNETPWGVSNFLRHSSLTDLPRCMSVQNPYNLLNRLYEVGLAEISVRENCGLLAYSPLAFGMLSGKYLNNQKPKLGRLTLFPQFARYSNSAAMKATERYKNIADEAGLSLAQMALAFVNSRRFLTSNIIGATTMDQLKENIGSADVVLSDEVLKEINLVHREFTNPTP